MWKALKRRYRYLTARLEGRLEDRADPRVQLQQAIDDAERQHRVLVEQAGAVIARQKQTELQLNRAMDELAGANHSTREALTLAQRSEEAGDAAKAVEYTRAAEGFANELLAAEARIADLKAMSLQSTQASEQAKDAVQQNSVRLRRQLAERHKLLNQLEQAKMQEQLNAATSELDRTVGGDVPTLDQVRDKIEARYARAVGIAEVGATTVEARMAEVERATTGALAAARLEEIRAQLALDPAEPEA